MSKSVKSKKPAKDTQRKRASQSPELEFTYNSASGSVSGSREKLGQEGVVGYVQNVSPPKQSRKNTEYSNFKLQCKSALIPGGCFSSAKRSILAEREATKTAVKLDRFNYAADGKTIFVNDMTKISVPNSSEYDFQFTDRSIQLKDLHL